MSDHTVILAEQDYPLLNLFWTMLWFFLWIMWLFLLFRIIADIFRSDDLSGWGKAAWSIFVILLPFLGVFTYVIVRGTEMHQHDAQQAQASEQAFRSYVKETAGTESSTAEELTKLAALRDQGVLTEAEFNAQKTKILA